FLILFLSTLAHIVEKLKKNHLLQVMGSDFYVVIYNSSVYPLCPWNGSINSRMFRPSASKIPTIKSKVNPGKNANHHKPMDKYCIDSDKIIPIAGLSEDKPNPKKVIAASCKIACGNNRTNPIINWGIKCGKK